MPTTVQGNRRDANAYVSARFRLLRRERDLSQADVSRLLSATYGARWTIQAVSRAELCRGDFIKRWSVDDLLLLAEAFDVPATYFLPDV
jgi:transcriptional regulator with XRE-family HTH domain